MGLGAGLHKREKMKWMQALITRLPAGGCDVTGVTSHFKLPRPWLSRHGGLGH